MLCEINLLIMHYYGLTAGREAVTNAMQLGGVISASEPDDEPLLCVGVCSTPYRYQV
jgi:hypothetical protein